MSPHCSRIPDLSLDPGYPSDNVIINAAKNIPHPHRDNFIIILSSKYYWKEIFHESRVSSRIFGQRHPFRLISEFHLDLSLYDPGHSLHKKIVTRMSIL
jgi:hypothetical protein